jgi:carbonic anhydrase
MSGFSTENRYSSDSSRAVSDGLDTQPESLTTVCAAGWLVTSTTDVSLTTEVSFTTEVTSTGTVSLITTGVAGAQAASTRVAATTLAIALNDVLIVNLLQITLINFV